MKAVKTNTITCSICSKIITTGVQLKPLSCYKKHGSICHKICKKCWFNIFAVENTNHKCPGCLKNLPFQKLKTKSDSIRKKNCIIIN